jgi:hypothetical protein
VKLKLTAALLLWSYFLRYTLAGRGSNPDHLHFRQWQAETLPLCRPHRQGIRNNWRWVGFFLWDYKNGIESVWRNTLKLFLIEIRLIALAAWRSGHRIHLRNKKRDSNPPGYKVFRENIAVLFCIKWLNMHWLCVEIRNTVIGQKII